MPLTEHAAFADFPHPFLRIGDSNSSSEVVLEGTFLSLDDDAHGAVMRTAREPGPVSITLLHTRSSSEQDTVDTQWDVIEEGTIELTGTHPRLLALTGEPILDLTGIEPGTYRIRASATNRHRTNPDSPPHVTIELTKIEAPLPKSLIRDTDGVRCEDPYTPNFPVLPEDRPHTARPPHATDTPPLAQSWDRITTWCTLHSPDTLTALADGASERDITATESLFPHPWPEDLRTFYRLQNGFRPNRWAQLLPAHDLLSLEALRNTHNDQLTLTRELAAEDPDIEEFITSQQPELREAGTPAGIYLDSFIPVAERDGYLLLCDTRPGPLNGCITQYGRDTADESGPTWPSLAALLDDLATALATGATFDEHWHAVTESGTLTWNFAR